jgi:DNA modification methylase
MPKSAPPPTAPALVPLAALHPAAWNPRSIRDVRFKNLCDSIQADPDFLWQRPILADASGEIFAGNMRFRAVQHLGWREVPAIVSDVPARLAKERAMRDNNQWGDLVEQDLAELLVGLQMDGSDLQLLGFPDDELTRLLDSVGALGDTPVPEAQIDRAAELQAQWGTALGDLWEIPSATVPGRAHRLLCGDSTDGAAVARLMDGARADIVLTDPPYGMDLDTDWSSAVGSLRSIGRQHSTRGKTYDRVVGDAAPFDPAPIFEQFGYCAEIFLWGADYYAERIPNRAAGSWLVWDKRKESQSEAIGSEFELCWSRSAHKRRMLRHDWFGFLSSENGSEARQRVHPTQKPTSLMRDILEQWSRPEAVVVDPYLGAGVVMLAAEQTGRIALGIEIDPGYTAVCLQRLTDLGLTPRRVEARA